MREATRISPADWLKDQYARVRRHIDVIRFAEDAYAGLSAEEKDKLRQTEIEPGEIVRVLGRMGEHALVMKFDRTLGWVPDRELEAVSGRKGFPPISGPRTPPAEFLGSWKGIPYVWGGASRRGIDCSGFTQRFFLEVHGVVIPKNSRDQRKAGQTKELPLEESDLIFCHPRSQGPGSHHVALFYGGEIWHARREMGVVRQSWDEFVSGFEVEEIVRIPL